ncbi:17684_t:CDS:2 [Acaulospora morrowiae]|uniref:17684_t:CDS:1 n=1 Tax=Acaulospora morrowiae TaxID=94023 RepID=A0A9N8VCQ5_9GLOM|nr:17684_t:CDS:2 [Acaulospora morrowiae]
MSSLQSIRRQIPQQFVAPPLPQTQPSAHLIFQENQLTFIQGDSSLFSGTGSSDDNINAIVLTQCQIDTSNSLKASIIETKII